MSGLEGAEEEVAPVKQAGEDWDTSIEEVEEDKVQTPAIPMIRTGRREKSCWSISRCDGHSGHGVDIAYAAEVLPRRTVHVNETEAMFAIAVASKSTY